MVKRTIIWTHNAVIQRRNIFIYWNNRNGSSEYSKRLLGLIRNRLILLIKFPEVGKLTDYPNLRVVVIENYLLFYFKNEDTILIIAFWDNRQDPSQLFRNLTT
jgi:plasmid stabilization system protein ParE